jgi:hypothetical protein
MGRFIELSRCSCAIMPARIGDDLIGLMEVFADYMELNSG